MTRVVSIINFKGGVGKSTVTFNLGSELACKGKKVLLIDFDGQGNLSSFAGIKKNQDNLITVLDKIMKDEDIDINPIYSIDKNMDIIPCDIKKESWLNRAISEIGRETILKRYITRLKEDYSYDYILIDNAPSIQLDLQNALVACDMYLIVTEPEIASADGIYTIYNIIGKIRQLYNSKLKPAGIVINKVEKRTSLHNMMNALIQSSWGEDIKVFNSEILKSILAGESEFLNKPISSHSPKSKIRLAFVDLAEEFLEIK